MCGFSGCITHKPYAGLENLLNKMGNSIQHRGPDGSGTYISQSGTLGLVHRRLAIQDLSPLGHQPMLSNSKRYVIAFNGEIYNFKKLKMTLVDAGHTFVGGSDTEVILAAFEEWGVKASLAKFNGMFAMAIFDQKEQVLLLTRDRTGEKPLYYGTVNGNSVFSSELKPIKEVPFWNLEVDRNVLPSYLRHHYVPAPYSIYKNVKKLLPGHYVSISLKTGVQSEPISYWNVDTYFKKPSNLSYSEITKNIQSTLEEVISEQLISDAPIGAFLSGGIDSSLTVAIMQKMSASRIKTFSIGFDNPEFNEAKYAKDVAKHIGTEHTELYMNAQDALDIVPNIPTIYDEPFADSSQLSTFLLCKLTKQQGITVALSGDGGDELFAGYERYFDYAKKYPKKINSNKIVSNFFQHCPKGPLSAVIETVDRLSGKVRDDIVREKLQRHANLLGSNDFSEFYLHAISHINSPERYLLNTQEYQYANNSKPSIDFGTDYIKQMMWHDMHGYLPDDILVKVDRAAMANSLEVRVPLLDSRIVEQALSIPTNINYNGESGKQILRNILFSHVPRQLVDRPKTGFANPIGGWLRNELRYWAEDLLDEKKLKEQGYFDPVLVKKQWEHQMKSDSNFAFPIWGILTFQAWLAKSI